MPRTPVPARTPASSVPLRRVIRASTASTASSARVHRGGHPCVAAQDVGLAQAGAQVVARGHALLGGGGVVGPGGLLDHLALRDERQQAADGEHGRDRGEREEEERRPPGERRDEPQRARREQGAGGHPDAPAQQLADLPGVVVDAVEDLAHGLLAEVGERLGHRGVEQVGPQPALGPVDDAGPDRLGDGVDERGADDADRQGHRQALGGLLGEPPGHDRAQRRADGADEGEREAEDRQRLAQSAPVDGDATRAPGRATASARCGRVRKRCPGCSR